MGGEFQTLLGLLQLPFPQLPTLVLSCLESSPSRRSLKSPLFLQHFFLAGVSNGRTEWRVKSEPRSPDWDLRLGQRPPILPQW